MNPDPIATVNDYPGLQRAMRARADALKISRATLNEMCGLQEGHVEKLLSDPPKKNMGILSFGAVLQALGLKLVVTEDPEMMAVFADERVQRSERHVRMRADGTHEVYEFKISRRMLRKLAVKGGHARAAKLTKRQRSASARVAALARWHVNKKRKITSA